MTRWRLMAFLSIVLLVSGTGWSKTIQIPRQPDYHNGKIVFSYLGSIWVVNENGSSPQRLTVNAARDTNPRFSPDGKWIAFSSNRFGNNDVFIIAATGGEPKQLTFSAAQDTVVGWSRDSKRVIFTSARGRVFPGVPSLYEVSIEGGLEQPINADWGYWGSYSPDGSKFVFNRHAPIWWRKHYRGSYAADLWVMDVRQKTFRRILDNDVPDEMKADNSWPQWGNGAIYFVSDRETRAKAGSPEVMVSRKNLWKISPDGGTPVQLTHFKDGSLFYPSISSDGKVIVFEEGFRLWKFDTASGKASEVQIDIAADEKTNNFEVLTIKGETDSYHLSPSTLRAAISAHGEIFTVATDRGDVTRVTRSYWRDTDPRWSPDGKWVAFISDQSGRDEVWVADTEGKNAKKLSDADTEKLSLNWMPDSKALVYTASDHGLYLVGVDDGQTRRVASNDVGNINGASISPDGKWLAYAKQDHNLRSHVYLVSASGGEEHRLSDERLFSTFAPRWTDDGKKLIFLGGYAQGGLATIRENATSLYSVSLAAEDKNPMSRDIDNEEAARASERANRPSPGGPGGEAREAKPPEVVIDFAGLERRIHQITRLASNITTLAPAPDSRTYAFVAVREGEGRSGATLSVIGADGEGLREVTRSQPPAPGEVAPPPTGFGGGAISRLEFSRDGRTLYFMERNALWAVSLGGGAAESVGGRGGAPATGTPAGPGGRRRVNFTVRVEVDNRVEHNQIFNQVWRVMKNRFYDKNMHGADWAHFREVYEPLLADAEDREEVQNIALQMIGELNASHTGMSGGGEPNRNAVQPRYPGFELEPDASGYYKVAFIYKNGPADHDYVRLAAGNFILAVDGQPLHSGDNYWKNFNLGAGRKIEFTVNSKTSPDGAWTTKVEPGDAADYATLQYERWVEQRRQLVEKLSNGEIGYLHIRQMNAEALHKFERDLSDNHLKKALIIDERFNGGGGIDEQLLQILIQRQYQYTRNRDSIYITRPLRAFFGPMVVVQNERSFSDAEMFPDGFRRLGLGKTVGVNTNGSVIATGSFRLIDGSSVRTPGGGVWDISGQNTENYGVPADVYVDNSPSDFLAGRDAQIEKAVTVLQEELRKNPPKAIPGR